MAKAQTPSKQTRREKSPLDLRLSVAVNFGDEEHERVQIMEDQEIRMVGSIFRYRDRIARFTTVTLMKAAMLQPRIAAKLLPGLSLLLHRNARDERGDI